jgi:flavin-dependent thymidylate synthase
MIQVILAGYNIDYELIRQMKELADMQAAIRSGERELPVFPSPETYTPETLSAAYARISRYPQPVPELRSIARTEVAKARKSNETIIFGLGHSSVAEHAVFNFDILHLSRLAVEFLERFRLASFTEKSQRYITLDGDFVIPEEIKGTPYESPFIRLIEEQNQAYRNLYDKLLSYMKKKYSDLYQTRNGQRTVEGWAKEDARYTIALATEAQLGMTVNARTLEYMIARARAHPLHEIRQLGQLLYESVHDLAPSIIKYPEPTPYFRELENMYAGKYYDLIKEKMQIKDFHDIKVLSMPESIEDKLMELYRFSCGKVFSSEKTDTHLWELIAQAHSWDSMPRFFESIQFEFEIILSAAAYGQLKRHRMSTQITQPYDPAYGITIPPSIQEIGEEQILLEMAARSEELFYRMHEEFPLVARYILLNAHRRKVYLQMNLRELFHFVRLRSDIHAQWDIRILSQNLSHIIRNKLPHLGILLNGKDQFEKSKEQFIKEIHL